MPDWESLVRQQLVGLSLEAGERREVIAELAAHLEETFEQLRRRGFSEEVAVERALSQVGNWQSLRRKIQKARREEVVMTDRVTSALLMGLVAWVVLPGVALLAGGLPVQILKSQRGASA